MSLLRTVLLLAAAAALAAVVRRASWRRAHAASRDADTLKAAGVGGFDLGRVPIAPLCGVDAAARPPQPYRPWSSGKFAMTMGLATIRQDDWLAIDRCYGEEQELRRRLLRERRDQVLQVLPGSEAACAEALELVVSFLTRRYPDVFYRPRGQPDCVHNRLTGKTFRVREPLDMPALEVAAQLAMEDLNLLIQGWGDDPGQHYLAASFSMAPAGWHLEERIGWPLWKIHAPVPLWEEKLRRVVEKSFLRMRPDALVARHNFFVQLSDVLFQQEPFVADMTSQPSAADVRIRHERQTLRRLPRSGAILFTVRTYMTPLTELADEPESVRALLGAVQEMHPAMAKYKGRDIWRDAVEAWCRETLGRL